MTQEKKLQEMTFKSLETVEAISKIMQRIKDDFNEGMKKQKP